MRLTTRQDRPRIWALSTIACALILIGLSLLLYASTWSPYVDRAEYEKKSALIADYDSEQFFALRDASLSPKYTLEDYGITLILCSSIPLALLFVHSAPDKKWKIGLVGLIAAITTAGGDIYRLTLELSRGAYPWWSDSVAIPIIGAMIMMYFLVAWAIIIAATGFIGAFNPGAALGSFNMKKASKIHLVFLAATLLILLFSAIYGQFEWIVPAVLWAYFYLSIIVCRQEAHPTSR